MKDLTTAQCPTAPHQGPPCFPASNNQILGVLHTASRGGGGPEPGLAINWASLPEEQWARQLGLMKET